MPLPAFLRRTLTRLKDAARYSRLTGAVALTRSLAGHRLAGTPTARAAHLLQAYRFTFRRFWVRRLAAELPAVRRLPDADILAITSRVWSWSGAAPAIDRTVLLKAPAPGGERGILLSFAEYNWLRLVREPDAARFVGERYHLVLTAGWSPLDYSLLEAVLRAVPGTVFLQPCNRAEAEKVHAFSPRLACLPTLGCDWIDPDLYAPLPRNRRPTDLVMVANWAPFKRHWHLFAALRDLPDGLRVKLIGQPDGPHTVERVRRQAADFGVRQGVEFLDRLPVERVQDELAAAKVSVILSRHEGYCGAVTESLFADTPVGLHRDAYIGSKDYINPQTGVLLPHHRLGRALADFLARADEFRPRAWAVEHVSCHRSLEKLTAVLRDHEVKAGRPWTADPAPFCWRPYPTLLGVPNSVRAAADELVTRFPTLFRNGLLAHL